ncbi:MAG: amidohydrolase family protein [Thermoplasmata archaeon]|nr:amidohydrolase family protein [Thermoplasmata archaeon]
MPVRPRIRRSPEEPRPEPSHILAGRGLQRGRLHPLEVGLGEGGEILALGRNLVGARRHDLGEAVLLPAAVDMHVHLRSPDSPREGESWARGTVQAALGGVGVVGEMPNTDPPASTGSHLTELAARGRGRLAVDLLQYGVLFRAKDAPGLGRVAGALKLYLAPTTGIDPPADQDSRAELLASAARTGLALSVHAEDPDLFRSPETAANAAEWCEARPVASEEKAVDELLQKSPPALRLHIAHVTSAKVAQRLRTAGQSFEVSPHHLLLAARSSDGPRFKVNPPLRSEPDRLALWSEFAAGRAPILASDHAPHPLEAKERPFPLAPAGIPGVGTMLPLMLARCRRGDLSLPELVAAACDRPARWLGLPVGRLALGHRGGVIAIDFRKVERFRAVRFPDSCGWSPFEGSEMIFPIEHWRGGERIVEGGEYTGRPTGSVVRPEYAPR